MAKEIKTTLTFYLGYFLFKCLHKTLKIAHIYPDGQTYKTAYNPKKSFLLSAWHEHVIMIIMSQSDVPFNPVVSRSKHGEFVGFVCKKYGYSPLYGSQDREGKDKGGTSALFGMLKALKRNQPVAITVDGSIGPRRHVKQGIIDLARKTNAPIIPVACRCTNYWELNTWDRLKIPKPFSKIEVIYGHDITVDSQTKKEQFEEMQKQIGDIMNTLESSQTK